jgi:hypothetical protein
MGSQGHNKHWERKVDRNEEQGGRTREGACECKYVHHFWKGQKGWPIIEEKI